MAFQHDFDYVGKSEKRNFLSFMFSIEQEALMQEIPCNNSKTTQQKPSPALMRLFLKLQDSLIENAPESLIFDLEEKVCRQEEISQAYAESLVRQVYERADRIKKQKNKFSLLLQGNLFAPEVVNALNDQSILKEVKAQIEKLLLKETKSRLDNLAKQRKDSEYYDLLDRLKRTYSALLNEKSEFRAVIEHSTRLTSIMPSDHRINTLRPREGAEEGQGWILWIDESGELFNRDSNSSGIRGCMVALLFPADSRLRRLDASFHAAHTDKSVTDAYLRELLASECGVIGLSASSDGPARDGWLALLHNVVKWAMRLIPLPENGSSVALSIYIEERSEFTRDIDPLILHRDFRLFLGELGRSREAVITLTDVNFLKKNSGMLGWVDLVANYWGSPNIEKRRDLRAYGLLGACLFEENELLLRACATALDGRLITGAEWQLLTEHSDAAKKGSLIFLALEKLRETCGTNGTAWKTYINAMSDYLDTKAYRLDVLNCQAEWLRHAGEEFLPKHILFFAKLIELAQFNHEGVIDSPELNVAKTVVESLADNMALLYPQTDVHAALRLAVCDSNAFDFEKASARLDRWNPQKSGEKLEGEAAGKVFSSLGQYEAFLNRFENAANCFELAIKQFKRLHSISPQRARIQIAQTASYAAVNAMNTPGCTQEKAAEFTERALGMDIMSAISDEKVNKDRFALYLLFRYLALFGTNEEKNTCLLTSRQWLEKDGKELKHPWPIIWYYRWSIARDADLRHSLEEQLLRCRGKSGITVDFICLVLEVAAGLTDPASPVASALLDEVERLMPKASDKLAKLRVAVPGQSDIVAEVLTFNYR